MEVFDALFDGGVGTKCIVDVGVVDVERYCWIGGRKVDVPKIGGGIAVSDDDVVVVVSDGGCCFVERGSASGVAKLSDREKRVLEGR